MHLKAAWHVACCCEASGLSFRPSHGVHAPSSILLQGKRARLRTKFLGHAAASAPRAAVSMAPGAVVNAANLLSSPRVEVLWFSKSPPTLYIQARLRSATTARRPCWAPPDHTAAMPPSAVLKVLAAAIALLNNLVADDDVRATVRDRLAADKANFQVRLRHKSINVVHNTDGQDLLP